MGRLCVVVWLMKVGLSAISREIYNPYDLIDSNIPRMPTNPSSSKVSSHSLAVTVLPSGVYMNGWNLKPCQPSLFLL